MAAVLGMVTVQGVIAVELAHRKSCHLGFQFLARLEPDDTTVRNHDLRIWLLWVPANYAACDPQVKGAEGAQGNLVSLS